MNINKRIIETKTNVIKVLSDSKLPLAILDLILTNIHHNVTNELGLQLMKEQETSEEEKTEVE